MKKFTNLKSIPAYLPIVNIDTDMIIPKQFLKTIKRTGLGKSLFFEMRYDQDGNEIKDFILNKECKDVDILVIGDGISAAKKIANTIDPNISVTVFKNFGTAYFKHEEYEIEFVGSRKESYVSSSRNPIVQTGTLEDDINRRDFKINSIAISLNTHNFGELVDLHDGLSDINQKIINTPLDSNITFSDDPLRMLRAIRFAAQLDFQIAPNILESIHTIKKRIEIISWERITEEIIKSLKTEKPSIAFYHFKETGLLKYIFPELDVMSGVEVINGMSHKDVFIHTLQVVDNAAKLSPKMEIRFAALVHDIAKPPTKKFDAKKGWSYHGHEELGRRMLKTVASRMKISNQLKDYLMNLTKLHLRPIALAKKNITDSAIRRLMFDAGDNIDDLMILCRADITTKNQFKS